MSINVDPQSEEIAVSIVCLLGGQGDLNKAVEPICSGSQYCSFGSEFLCKHTEKDN